MKCFKIILLVIVLCSTAVFALSSCGYNIGARGMAHPQLKSMAIGDIQNNTIEPHAAGYMRMEMAEAIQRDGGMILKNIGESDCIVYGTISNVTTSTSRSVSFDNDRTYQPAAFKIQLTVDYKIIVPGMGTPVASGSATGEAEYEYLGDPQPSRVIALKLACYRVAEQIVHSITEGF